MNSKLVINFSEFDKLINRMQKNTDQLKSATKAIKSQCLVPLRNEWEGADNITYVCALESELKELEQFVKKMEAYVWLLKKAQKRYSTAVTDASNQSNKC